MNKKQIFKIEYFVYFFVLLLPIFDFVLKQYIKTSSYDVLLKLNVAKLIIPLMLFLYILFKVRRKEKLQFFLVTFIYLIYSSVFLYLTHISFIKNKINQEKYFDIFNNIFNLTIMVFNFLIVYKLFYRKNTTRLRMSYNYVSAIYLISILLLSLISQTELIWHIRLPIIMLMLIFVSLVSLRYREDRTYSLILFIALTGYYITTIKTNEGYYAVLMVAIIYIVSIVIEKYVNNRLTLADVNKIVKSNIQLFINNLRSLNKTKVKRLKSGERIYLNKKIKTYSSKRIYRFNDFNRRKVFKSNDSVKKHFVNLTLKREDLREKGSGLKEVEKRLRQKKKQRRQERIDNILNSLPMRILFTGILFSISLFILYIIYKYAKSNLNAEFNIKDNIIYIIYFIPLILVMLRVFYFSITKFKKIDSEFIMLSLLVLFILFKSAISNTIIIDFTSGIIISTLLVVLINKIHIGKTSRDVEILKEKLDYKKGITAKRRVVFGISSLAIGGVSRILVDICTSLSKKHTNLDIEIFTLFGGGEFEEGIPVKVISLFKKPFNSYSKHSKLFISLYIKLFEPNIFNKYIRGNYDTLVAFDEGAITNLFSYCSDSKKIAWIHNKNYDLYSKDNKKYLKSTSRVYSHYDKIIFTREIGLRRFNKVFKNRKIRKIPKDVITNYVDPLRIYVKSEEESVVEWTEKDRVLLSVVRLYKHKSIERFIKVHKRILNDGISHKIYIIGDGPEMENLKKLIREEKLLSSVFLLGTKVNPYPYIRKCNYFCLFSEKEEYSIVLNEAKILNKNILITDTKTRDVIQDYPNARVFENSESGIYTGLRYVLTKVDIDRTNFEYIYKNDDILKQIYCLLE